MQKKQKYTRRTAVKLVVAGLAAPALMKYAHAAEITLKLHHFLPPVAAGHRTMMVPFADRVREATNGRLDIQIYPSLQLGGRPSELATQVRDGVVDMAWVMPHYQPGRFPFAEVWTLPFMVTNSTETSQAIFEYMDSENPPEISDFKPLAWWSLSAGILMTKGFGVEKAEDLKGKRILGGNENMLKTLEILGANGMSFPASKAAQKLTTNAVDGLALPYELIPAFRLHELIDHYSESAPSSRGLYTVPMSLLMNRRRYEALPDDLRVVLDGLTGKGLSAEFGKTFDANDAFGKQMAIKAGGNIHTISADETKRWREMTMPVVEDFAKKLSEKNLDGLALIKKANSLIEKFAS